MEPVDADSKQLKSSSVLVIEMTSEGKLEVELILDDQNRASYTNMLAAALALSLRNTEWRDKLVRAIVQKINGEKV